MVGCYLHGYSYVLTYSGRWTVIQALSSYCQIPVTRTPFVIVRDRTYLGVPLFPME